MKNADVYKHKKTGNEYVVLDLLINCTNKDDGKLMVSYKSMDLTKKELFVRNAKEFDEKFEFVRNLYDSYVTASFDTSNDDVCCGNCDGSCDNTKDAGKRHEIFIKRSPLGFALTECPHGVVTVNYNGKTVSVKVGSIECYHCDHYHGFSVNENSVYCSAQGDLLSEED